VTPQEIRRKRLEADFEYMRMIRRPPIFWQATHGTAPYVDQYALQVRVRTIVGPGPDYADEVRLKVELPPGYPLNAAPVVSIDPGPLPYHPNWFPNGVWCHGNWAPGDNLAFHIIRMVRTLQFEPAMTNLDSPANGAATQWWRAVQHRGWFPTDRQPLPDPSRRAAIKIRTVHHS